MTTWREIARDDDDDPKKFVLRDPMYGNAPGKIQEMQRQMKEVRLSEISEENYCMRRDQKIREAR
jgi:hypothetical protein